MASTQLLTRDKARAALMAVGPEAQLMDFAQKLIDDGIVIDVAKLETIAGNALARAAAGPPSSNPLFNEAPAAAAPAGAGQTTLAAMVAELNEQREDHMITVEDPLGVVQTPKGCNVTQREVGPHTKASSPRSRAPSARTPTSSASANSATSRPSSSPSLLRLDGHVRLRHAPPQQRAQDHGPHHQRLSRRGAEPGARHARRLPGRRRRPAPRQKGAKGRVAVRQILLQHEALPNTIRMGRISNIRGIIESGANDGMITMVNSLLARVKDGTVEPREAYMKGSNKALFASLPKPGDLDGGHQARRRRARPAKPRAHAPNSAA